VRPESVARRYASAMLATVAAEDRALVDARLAEAAALLRRPPLDTVFLHPAVPAAEKAAALAKVFVGDPPVAHLVGVLIRHRRETLLDAVARQFHQGRLQAEGRVLATVRTAHPLDAGWRDQVVRAVSRRSGRQVDAEFMVVPELLGGIEVRIGDQLWDGTIRGRLTRLARQLKDEVKPGES